MTRQQAVDCLTDKAECRYCKASSENCRQDAERMAARSLEAWDEVRKSLNQLDHIYMNVSGQMIRIYPQWNVDRIIEEHMREVEE